MAENIIKQRALHKYNFTVCHNEILFQKKVDGTPLSLETIGLFWRLMSLPPNWKLTKQGLMTICGCGRDKIDKCLNELKQLGYLKAVQTKEECSGCFEPNTYYVFETLDNSLWNNSEDGEIINIDNENLPEPENLATDLPATDLPATENLTLYNMLNNKNNNINKLNINISESDSRVTSDYIASDPLNEPLNLTILDKNNSNLINMESAKGCQKGSKKGLGAKLKEEERRNNLNKERQEKIDAELNKPKTSVANIVAEKMSDLKEEDNILANAKKLVNVANEKFREAEYKSQKKIGIKKRILTKVDKDIQNQELAIVLKDYLSMWIEKGKTMTEEVYKAQLNNLYTLSRDPKEQVQIVKKSIQKGWLDLYPISNGSYKKETYKTQNQVYKSNIKQEDNPDIYEDAVDENGNPLVF